MILLDKMDSDIRNIYVNLLGDGMSIKDYSLSRNTNSNHPPLFVILFQGGKDNPNYTDIAMLPMIKPENR